MEYKEELVDNPKWDIKTIEESDRFLDQEIPRVLEGLKASSSSVQLGFLKDTRGVHYDLFHTLTPENFEAYAGTYRGELGTVLENRRTAIFYKNVEGLRERNPALNPQDVPKFMGYLADYIEKTWHSKLSSEEYFRRCSRVFGDFNTIHPYLDGNGHISRMILTILANRRDIEISSAWTIHPRPYDSAIGICMQNYKQHSVLLEQYLKKWFKV